MMNKLALITVAIASISGPAVASKGYGYGYGGGYGDYDYGSSDSSSEVALPVRVPEGTYYICRPAGLLRSKRCLTYKETPVPSDSSSSSSDCGGAQSDSSDSDPYVEAAKYRYVYASKKYASKFSLSYPNATTTVFNLACESCKNDYHGSTVKIVRRHLELENVDHAKSGEVGAFQAWKVDSDNTNTFYVQTVQKSIMKWWQISAIRKRMELATPVQRTKFQFYRTLGGAAVEAPAPAVVAADVPTTVEV